MKYLAWSLLAVTACAGSEATSLGTVRDSAGIQIAENSQPAGGVWTVGTGAVVRIGTLEDDADYQLYQVTGVARRADGVIVVANAGTHELRLYGPDGRFIRRVGRQGGGPGEFERLGPPYVVGDTMITYDWNQRRVSLFDTAGTFRRSFRVEPPPGTFPTVLVPFDDDRLLLRTGGVFGQDAVAGVRRDSASYYLVGWDGALLDSVGRFPDWERLVVTRDRGMSVTSRTFGLGTTIAAQDGLMYLGDNATYEVRVLNGDGDVVRIVRRTHTPVAVTADDIAASRARALENVEERFRSVIETLQDAMVYPETFPAYGAIQVDTDGFLWVQEYKADPREPSRWSIFDPDGHWVAEATTPGGFGVRAIGHDWILGTWRDELDVEYVLQYPLDRGPAT